MRSEFFERKTLERKRREEWGGTELRLKGLKRISVQEQGQRQTWEVGNGKSIARKSRIGTGQRGKREKRGREKQKNKAWRGSADGTVDHTVNTSETGRNFWEGRLDRLTTAS